MAAPIVELRGVTKRFTGVTAIANLSLQLVPGEVLCLLGENGAGKSTVIKILTGVETPTSGEVVVDGKVAHFASPRDARDKGIATVYQEVGTLPLMSVARNFVLAAEPHKGKGLFRRLDINRLDIDRLGRDIAQDNRQDRRLAGGQFFEIERRRDRFNIALKGILVGIVRGFDVSLQCPGDQARRA